MLRNVFVRLLALGTSLSSSVVFVHAVDLTKPLAGDWRCGANVPCQIREFFPQMKDMYVYSIVIVILLAIISIGVAAYKVLTASDQAAQMKEAKTNLGRSLVGLVVLAFFGTVMMVVFETLIKPQFNYLDDALSRVMEVRTLGVDHAYAQPTSGDPAHLPNALRFDSPYDVLIAIYQLAMRWVLIPILIASWVWAGFLFIYARGNPDGLKRARSRLFYAFVWTIIVMGLLGLFYAFKGTFDQVFS